MGRLLRRVGMELGRAVGSQFKARDHSPARVVCLGVVQAIVRAAALGPAKRGGREEAPEQGEIAHGERALELMHARLVGRPRLLVEAHRRHVLTLDTLVLRERFPECLVIPDRAKVPVRQHQARGAHLGLLYDEFQGDWQ